MGTKEALIIAASILSHATCASALGDDGKQAVEEDLDDEGFVKAKMIRKATIMYYKSLVRDFGNEDLFPTPAVNKELPDILRQIPFDSILTLLRQFIPVSDRSKL